MIGRIRRIGQTLFHLWRGLDDPEVRRRQAYRDLFSTPAGQEVLADIAMSLGVVTAAPPVDPYKDAFDAGARWAALQILEWSGVGQKTLAMAILNDDLSGAFDNADSGLDV
jgi:hypothetical protein